MTTVQFEIVNPTNIDQLKLLNNVLFPIAYKDQFYRDCTAFPEVTQLAYVDGELAGAIACRLEAQKGGDSARLYIMTIGVMSEFRRQGIGSQLVQRALDACLGDPDIEDAYLHVQVGNDDVIHFYERLGFIAQGRVDNYYRRLHPPHAVILAKKLEHVDVK